MPIITGIHISSQKKKLEGSVAGPHLSGRPTGRTSPVRTPELGGDGEGAKEQLHCRAGERPSSRAAGSEEQLPKASHGDIKTSDGRLIGYMQG